MTLKSTIARFAVLAAIVSAAWGNTINDPAMGLDDGSLSSPITGATFSPINGGGVFDFFNDTGHLITTITFQTTVLPGLSAAQLAAFICNDATTPGHPNPFFLNCSIGYESTTGVMDISFFGTDTQHPGILPLDTSCGDGDPLCSGHFFVTLNDGFSLTGANGGWNDPTLVGSNPIQFSVDLPEPSTGLLVAGALGVMAAIRIRRKRVRSS